MQSTPEAGQLVRSYSLEVENGLSSSVPPNDLRRVFVENERRLQREEEEKKLWREYYEPWKPDDENTDPTTKLLREKAILLSHAWKVFRTTIPKSEQEDLEGQVPSVEGLVGMVNRVAIDWHGKRANSKSGKFMKHFNSFSQTLDAHSYMLEVLPVGNEYVSLFTGVLKTIINASSNHEKVATGLGEALARISVHVKACEKEVRLHNTKAMQERIVRLYAHVFLYLEDTMEWYQKRSRSQFRDAFRQNFFDKFEATIVNIQNLSLDILREANVTSMAETRQIRLTAEETLEEVRFGHFDARLSMDKVNRKLAEIEYENGQLRLELQREAEERRQFDLNKVQRLEAFRNSLVSQIGTGMRHELERVAQNMLNGGQLNASANNRQPLGYIEGLDKQSIVGQSYQRDDMILDSNHLLDMFPVSDIESPYHPPYGILNLDTSAASRLKEWATDSDLHLLAIAGRQPLALEPPPMTILASMCIDFAIAAQLPVISYFCSLPKTDELREGNTREVQGLLSVAYGLIRQLIEQLPIQLHSELDFSKERLALLEGTLVSWSITISLMRDLVNTVPKPLFCIVDDLQRLNDWSTEELLEELVNILKGSKTYGTDTGRLKVLFTTTGRSKALVRCLDVKELVLADRDGAVNSAAHRGGNRQFLF